MKDMYEASLLCEDCHAKTEKGRIQKEGFSLRIWQCPKCKKQWYHPLDLENYKAFQELKNKDFQVKLRSVGNSWIVSIPKEIIRFEEISATKIVNLHLDEPGRVVVRFTRVRKIY